MESFIQRLIEEQKQLKHKIDKLRPFIQSDNFIKVSIEQQDLLKIQLYIMDQYNEILGRRISLLCMQNGTSNG